MSSRYYSDTQPKVLKSRSQFDLSFTNKTSFNTGDLIPFLVQEVIPGDTFKLDTSVVTRLSSAWVKAPMENLTQHLHYFFVPNRLIWDHWQEFMGENKETKWASQKEWKIPKLKVTKVEVGSLADYFGIPVGEYKNGLEISELPFRAYALIWNEWFRDQNNQDPVFINTGDTAGELNFEDWASDNIFGKPAKINKFMDYFTSALPSPQKGEPVSINIGDKALLGVNDDVYAPSAYGVPNEDLKFGPVINFDQFEINANQGEQFKPDLGGADSRIGKNDIMGSGLTTNLIADLKSAQAVSINDLRNAFQLQKLLEKDARGGTRYTEILSYQFGVTSDDARLQRPEFLGGSSTPIQNVQVPNTAGATTEDTYQAQIAAYTLANARDYTSKSFTEHGLVIGLISIRQKHTYQQGVGKYWLRDTRTDFYNPVFANIGEQPILTKEIYAFDDGDNIFGYKEAWNEYRLNNDIITGQMRSEAGTGFDLWHFGDDYENAPVLGDEFIKETPLYVDRAVAVPSTTAHQFIVDIYISNPAIRIMPTYSVPGFIDHN